MGSKQANAKDALKVAQSGTPVPAKDSSSSKKEAKAAGVMATPAPSPEPEKKEYEGSHKDWSDDWSASKRKGITVDKWENSAGDRIADAAGERRMKADEDKSEGPKHRPGIGAFSNAPKAAHGFGHPPSARDGHLRNSGHSGAHQIGRKK